MPGASVPSSNKTNFCSAVRSLLIFFDDQHIGGYDEARALEKENRLQDFLK
ncbi:hypothetical protein OAL61_03010 [Candidatus Pelagibacter sp.]|nr:hypothetical protein [Candidatus Pelagibacter sp.]MDC0569388.1 hypothetical protein [Candidatus Pelagibacter sp.]